jgi:hypothetical protein
LPIHPPPLRQLSLLYVHLLYVVRHSPHCASSRSRPPTLCRAPSCSHRSPHHSPSCSHPPPLCVAATHTTHHAACPTTCAPPSVRVVLCTCLLYARCVARCCCSRPCPLCIPRHDMSHTLPRAPATLLITSVLPPLAQETLTARRDREPGRALQRNKR